MVYYPVFSNLLTTWIFVLNMLTLRDSGLGLWTLGLIVIYFILPLMIDLAPPLAASPSHIERITTSRVSIQTLITIMSPELADPTQFNSDVSVR